MKPTLRSFAASSARATGVVAPRTTTISVRPSRVAVTTVLKPKSQMKPVFMPVVPG